MRLRSLAIQLCILLFAAPAGAATCGGDFNAFLSAMNKDRGLYRLPVERRQARSGSDNAETVLYSSDYSTFAFLAASCCRHIDEPEEAARALGRVLHVRADVRERFGVPHSVDLGGLLQWASRVNADEPDVAELTRHQATYAWLSKRAGDRGVSASARTTEQLRRVQHVVHKWIGRRRS